jgi:hypothetical protein
MSMKNQLIVGNNEWILHIHPFTQNNTDMKLNDCYIISIGENGMIISDYYCEMYGDFISIDEYME